MTPIRAVVFDLYGTLLRVRSRGLHREMPRILGTSVSAWLELVRDELLTRPFATSSEFARFICDRLASNESEEPESRCVAAIDRELASVEAFEGAISLLSFLKRRGYRLGVISNLSSSYKEPLARCGMDALFDATCFSCDEGVAKPDPVIYQRMCERLEVTPGEVLFVGDSHANDVEAPAALGMKTLPIGTGPGSLRTVSDLGWYVFGEDGSVRPLLTPDARFRFGAAELPLGDIRPVEDDEQGRYNVVYRLRSLEPNETDQQVYCKRYFLPESTWVEAFAHRMYRAAGFPGCDAVVFGEAEPLLAVSEAPGKKYDGELDPEIAWEVGRHFTFAYFFSNADIRPRNAFLSRDGSRPRITMIDLEHCFFNLAIDTSGIADPFDPKGIDALSDLPERMGKKVLTERAMRRARRSFVMEENVSTEILHAYRRGFLDCFAEMKERKDEIVGILRERIYRKPYLVIGTHGYRRAMAGVDLDDIEQRLEHDGVTVLNSFCPE
ncbi:MAG: HAD family hydrolase [Thermoanaerobaculia bacterium]